MSLKINELKIIGFNNIFTLSVEPLSGKWTDSTTQEKLLPKTGTVYSKLKIEIIEYKKINTSSTIRITVPCFFVHN